MAKNGDLKWKTDNAIDEAYRRGYTDGAVQGFKDGANAIWDHAYQTGYDDAKFQKEYAAYEEQETERHCCDCFYERLEVDKDPCKDCGTLLEGHTNWRPKVKKEETK